MRRFETFARLVLLIDKQQEIDQQLNCWSINLFVVKAGSASSVDRDIYHELLWLLDIETPKVMGIVR